MQINIEGGLISYRVNACHETKHGRSPLGERLLESSRLNYPCEFSKSTNATMGKYRLAARGKASRETGGALCGDSNKVLQRTLRKDMYMHWVLYAAGRGHHRYGRDILVRPGKVVSSIGLQPRPAFRRVPERDNRTIECTSDDRGSDHRPDSRRASRKKKTVPRLPPGPSRRETIRLPDPE